MVSCAPAAMAEAPTQILYDDRHAVLVRREARVLVIAGADRGRSCTIGHGRARIGTAADNDLTLGDPSVSRHHLEIQVHDRGYLLQGIVLLKKGDTKGAEKAWLQGLQQVPDSAILAGRLMQRYLAEGRLTEAEAVVKRLQSFAPPDDASQAKLNAMLGRLHEAKGMLYEARDDYRMAWQLAPGAKFYLLDVARMEHRMGNWDEAERIYRQLLAEGFQPERMKKLLEQVTEARSRGTEDAMRKVWLERKDGGSGQP